MGTQRSAKFASRGAKSLRPSACLGLGLGHPRVTQASPKGHPSVTQGRPRDRLAQLLFLQQLKNGGVGAKDRGDPVMRLDQGRGGREKIGESYNLARTHMRISAPNQSALYTGVSPCDFPATRVCFGYSNCNCCFPGRRLPQVLRRFTETY
jgi:hypothetical protein